MVQLVQDSSINDFVRNTTGLLYSDEATHNLMIGLSEGLMKNGPAVKPGTILLRWVEDDLTKAAALKLPLHNLVLSFAEKLELQAIAGRLCELKETLPGVVGPAGPAQLFEKIWTSTTEARTSQVTAQKLMKLTRLTPAPLVAGNFRTAKQRDLQLLQRWTLEFARESLPPHESQDEKRMRDMIARVIGTDRSFVWEVDGQVVAMTSIGRQTRSGVAIFGVYTPKEFRRKGYASSLVSQVSELQLKSGRQFCVLYTDASNPTSNKIYQNIGYQIVGDSKYFTF